MFSMTTMASSTTSPVASVIPNRVRVLMENPSSLTKAKVPISETGMVTAGMIVLRQSCKENKNHQDDQHNGRAQRADYIADGFAHGIRRIECDVSGHPGRKALRQPIQFRNRQAVDFKSVRGGELGDADPDRFVSVEHQIRAVVLGAEFGPAHILQPDQGSVGIGLQNDVVKLRWFR